MPKLPAPRRADGAALINALGQQFGRKRQLQDVPVRPVQQIQEGIIPTYYKVDGPTSGTVVGIVLGSVLGFLLLVWLFYSLANINNGSNGATNAIAGEEEIVVRRPRRNSHGGRSRRSSRPEVREYSRSPRSREPPIIVEERRQPRHSRSFVVEERSRSRVPGDDVVEVIEEHSDYQSRRGSRR